MNLYEAALQIATEAHEGQTRDSGEPYINHPMAIAELVSSQDWNLVFNSEMAVVVALLHDVIEDTEHDSDSIKDVLLDLTMLNHVHKMAMDFVIDSLRLLTRNEKETYCKYITRIKQGKNNVATAVKLADLTHNLSDHKPGARRDKYELAVALLEG